MNAKTPNMLEALMPAPPSVTTLINVLLEQSPEVEEQLATDPNFGDMYDDVEGLARNSARMQACVKGILRDFHSV